MRLRAADVVPAGTWSAPVLQSLLEDIRKKLVDVVVVYKVDQLTRSLSDFDPAGMGFTPGFATQHSFAARSEAVLGGQGSGEHVFEQRLGSAQMLACGRLAPDFSIG